MTVFSIRISGADDQVFQCEAGDTMLGSALRSGRDFPYECNSGGCGTCQFELLEGEIEDRWPEAPGIGARARERGRRLACQCVPTSDCKIKVSLTGEAAPAVAPRRQQFSFVEARALTADMSEFTFRGEGPAEFLPGQFAMFALPGVEGGRAYSMSNLANEAGLWSFVIKRVPAGRGTAVLFDTLNPGDTVAVDAPYGKSYLRTGNGRDIVCIAGGSGLSPVLSILRGAVREPELSDRRLILFYGGRGPRDMCLPEILHAEPPLRDRVTLHMAISDQEAPGADQWTGERGFVHELVRKTLGDDIPGFDYYFCGPPPMTDAVHRMLLLDCKTPAGQLHFDRFF